MAEKWNRKKRREMSRYGIGQEMMQEEFEKYFEQKQEYDYKYAWASAFAAVHELFGADERTLKRLAILTLKYQYESLCAEELIQELKDRTGFDVNQAPSEYEDEVNDA